MVTSMILAIVWARVGFTVVVMTMITIRIKQTKSEPFASLDLESETESVGSRFAMVLAYGCCSFLTQQGYEL